MTLKLLIYETNESQQIALEVLSLNLEPCVLHTLVQLTMPNLHYIVALKCIAPLKSHIDITLDNAFHVGSNCTKMGEARLDLPTH